MLLAGQSVGADFLHEFKHDSTTRFIVVDPDPVEGGALYNAVGHDPNTSDVFFKEGPGARLAGYLSVLMAEQSSGKRPVRVSEILVNKTVSANVRCCFEWGATDAVPALGVTVRTDYAGKFKPPSVCETIASQQIDSGSRVIYADAGACDDGAVSAARGRGVWVIEGDQDPNDPPAGPQIIGYTVKSFREEVDYAIRNFLAHTLPRSHHIDIGIATEAVNFFPTNLVPRKISDQLADYKGEHLNCWTSGRVDC